MWAQLLALAHNLPVDLRAKVDGGEDLKPRPQLKPLKGEGYRKVHARLRYRGIHADRERVIHGFKTIGWPKRTHK